MRPASANVLHHAVAVYGGHTEVHVIDLWRTKVGINGDHGGHQRSSVNVDGRLPFKLCHR